MRRVDDELAAKAEAARLENERIEKERLEKEEATRLALAKTEDNFPSLMGSPANVS